MQKLFTYFLISAAFFACELVIDIEQPDFDSSLVVQTNINNQEAPLLFLSQDYYILDRTLDYYGDDKGLSGATIMVYEDNELIGAMDEFPMQSSFQDGTLSGFYTIDHLPKSGHTYRFEVEKNGFTSTTGETTLPDEVLQYRFGDLTESVNEWGGTEYRMELIIDDPVGDHYYEIEITQQTFQPVFDDFGEVTEFLPVSYRIYIYSENIVIPEYQYDRLLFSDEIFEGRSYTMTFNAEIYLDSYLKDEYGLNEDSYITAKVRSCSKEYFNYYNTAALQSWNSGDPLVEPVPIYSNVTNGFGLIGSYYEEVDTLFTY
jgi:hypothetical protein